MAKARTQADQRKDLNAKDQFGRLWLLTIEIATGDPCGQIDSAGWEDPLRTPLKYKIVPKNEFGQQAFGSLFIDFDRWIRDQEGHLKQWTDRVYEIATVKFPSGFDHKTILDDPYIATRLTGPRPWPSLEVLRMAKAGHRKLLGLERMDNATRKLLCIPEWEWPTEASDTVVSVESAEGDPPDNWHDFYRWAKATGQATNLTEGSTLWKAHKEAMALG